MSFEMSGHRAKWRRGWSKFGILFMAKLVLRPSCHLWSRESLFFSCLLRCCMSTYDAWFPRYASEIGWCFSVDFSHLPWDEEVLHCQLFLPTACKGLTIIHNVFEYDGWFHKYLRQNSKLTRWDTLPRPIWPSTAYQLLHAKIFSLQNFRKAFVTLTAINFRVSWN